jgi:hypothetical protein
MPNDWAPEELLGKSWCVHVLALTTVWCTNLAKTFANVGTFKLDIELIVHGVIHELQFWNLLLAFAWTHPRVLLEGIPCLLSITWKANLMQSDSNDSLLLHNPEGSQLNAHQNLAQDLPLIQGEIMMPPPQQNAKYKSISFAEAGNGRDGWSVRPLASLCSFSAWRFCLFNTWYSSLFVASFSFF